MTIFRYSTVLVYFLFVLNDDVESQEITDDGRNGCRWQGGSISGLKCNCEKDAELTISSGSISSSSATEIVVNDCKTVTIKENAVAHLRNLRLISLNNVQSIFFETDSINWYGYRDETAQTTEEERFDVRIPSLKLIVNNSRISEISSHAFAGRISEITFDNVITEKISSLAFVNLLQTEKVIIKNSVLRDLGVHSFKKFSTEFLELTNVTAKEIPSRTFSNITVYQNVIVDNCDFNTVRSGGLTIYNPKIFQMINTDIRHLNGEAFKIISRGVIVFRNNTFGIVDDAAFAGIVIRKDIVLTDSRFIFDSNSISQLNPLSLSVSEPGVQFRNILLNESCECSNKMKESTYYEEIMCLYENKFFPLNNFIKNTCSVVSNYYMVIIIVCVLAALIVAIAVGLFVYYKYGYKSQKYGDKKPNKNGNMSLIVPDGRTYRETELHVIVERTDLLTTDL